MKKELICISCPIGCHLEVEYDSKEVLSVANNRCKGGVNYARKELFNPERIVTTTVSITNSRQHLVPVKTQRAIAKNLVGDVIKAVAAVTVKSPVKIGDVVLENVCGTGINVIVTRNIVN